LALVPLLGAEFVPKADFSETQVNFYTPVGSSLEVTEARARQVDAALREMPEVRTPSPPSTAALRRARSTASVYVRLVDRKERRAASTSCRCRCASGWRASPASPSPTSASRPGRRQEHLQFSIQGNDLAELERCGARAARSWRHPRPGGPGQHAQARQAHGGGAGAARRRRRPGPERQRVANTLRTLVAGQTVGNWRASDGETYDVRCAWRPEPATTAADLGACR
jgi:HAE1 family hydrophobic/amphiphilic exporter-1